MIMRVKDQDGNWIDMTITGGIPCHKIPLVMRGFSEYNRLSLAVNNKFSAAAYEFDRKHKTKGVCHGSYRTDYVA